MLTVWRTVDLSSTRDFAQAGINTYGLAEKMMGQISGGQGGELALVRFYIKDFDLGLNPGFDQIRERVESMGLILCPPVAGPQLRAQYPEQERGETIVLGMFPLLGGMFLVWRSGRGSYLTASSFSPILTSFYWVFVKPQ